MTIWRKYNGSLIPDQPPHILVNDSENVIAKKIKEHNSYFARWTSNFDCQKQTDFWYVINDRHLKIEDYKLEIEELFKAVPKEWKEKNEEFKIIFKSKNIQTKKYRKNVDQAYENLNQITIFIQDHKKLNKLSTDVNKLKNKINEKDYKNSILISEDTLKKIKKISGTEELANRLNELKSLLNNSELDSEKIVDQSLKTFNLYNKEIKWRSDANKNLLSELMKYNLVIKDNIGLRLQSKLTKDQAKYVASCNSVHRDISLNF